MLERLHGRRTGKPVIGLWSNCVGSSPTVLTQVAEFLSLKILSLDLNWKPRKGECLREYIGIMHGSSPAALMGVSRNILSPDLKIERNALELGQMPAGLHGWSAS